MKQQRDLIVDYLSAHPDCKKRKNRYYTISQILELNYGMILEPAEIKLICSLADEYRHQTQADDIGLELEREWHASPAVKGWNENRLFELRNITSDEIKVI